MASYPGLETYLRQRLDWEFRQSMVDFDLVRSVVSSPRLMSFSVRSFSDPRLIAAGDSYLSSHTMIADGYQKTYALSIADWFDINGVVERVERCQPFDAAVMNIQIWPFAPSDLDKFGMAVAVALSYTPAELMAESRISLALDELMKEWGYSVDDS